MAKLAMKFSAVADHKIQLSERVIPWLSFEYVLGGQHPFNASFQWI